MGNWKIGDGEKEGNGKWLGGILEVCVLGVTFVGLKL